MRIDEFLKTVYLGDRACKSLTIDGWNSEVKVQVTCISRVRSKNWNYYDAEDLINGYLVFEGVNRVDFEPVGPLPNDLINDIRVEKRSDIQDLECVILSIDSVDAEGHRVEVLVRLFAKEMALEAEGKPGERIRT
jgi:hypothetical protein